MSDGKVLAAPAALGLSFTIEHAVVSASHSRMIVNARGGHKITGTGLRAILGTLNTYFGTTLSAAQVDGILVSAGSPIAKLGNLLVEAHVMTADVGSLTSSLTSNLQAANAVVNG